MIGDKNKAQFIEWFFKICSLIFNLSIAFEC